MRVPLSRKLIFSAALLLVLLASFEIALRLSMKLPEDLSFGATNWILEEVVLLDDPNSSWVGDPDLLWRIRPGTHMNAAWTMGFPGSDVHISTRLNAQGWRNPELAARRPGERRVLHLGDSCTFGLGVRDGETYSERLPALLERRGSGSWTSINAGVLSYSSYQGRRLLERYAEQVDPDVVTLYFGWNDAWPMSPDAENRMTSEGASGALLRALYRSEAFRRIRWFASEGIRADLNAPRVSIEEFRGNVIAMIEHGRRDGFEVVLLTGPAGPDIESLLPRAYPENRQYVAELRLIAAETGAPLVDAARFFADHEELLFHDMIHPSGRGHELIAEALAETMHRVTRASRSPQLRSPRPDVLFVTTDRLGAQSPESSWPAPGASTALDALAAQGMLFEQAHADDARTVPALGSLLATDGSETLAERLAAAGYRTGAFVDADLALAPLGFDRGFDRFQEGPPSPEVVAEWLDAAVTPALLWVHVQGPPSSHEALDAVLEVLRERDAARDSILVLTSVEGDQLRVPLLLRLPWTSAARIRRPVRHVDVVSTVLEGLDLPAREGDEGRPLVAGSARAALDLTP